MAPFGADLLSAVTKPDRIGAEIDALYLPLQVSPVGSLENVDFRFLRIRPFLLCEGGRVEAYSFGSLGGKGHVVIFTSKGIRGVGADRTSRLNVSRLPRIRRIKIRITGANLTFAVDEELGELQPRWD